MQIQSTENLSSEKLNILVYGDSGSGKTTLAKTLNEPCFVISAEGGLLSLHGAKIDYVDISVLNGKPTDKKQKLELLMEVYKKLSTPEFQKKYSWVFLDSLTEIAQNIVESLQEEYSSKQALPMWGEYNKKIRSVIKSFRDLPHYNVVMTALSAIEVDENQRRFVGVDLPGRISKQVYQFFDEVFYLSVLPDDTRALVTSKKEKIQAKDRSGMLDLVEVCDLGVVAGKIRGTNKKEKKK